MYKILIKALTAFCFIININSSLSATRIDYTITLTDGVILDCTKFIPDGGAPAGGWSVIILCHGYGESKEVMLEEAEDLADNDFYTMTYSMRGQGNSTGLSNLISMTEANDLIQVVQRVKLDYNTNDNRIAIKGGSQGGIIPFMAACSGANVRTILSDLSSPEFASNWIENNSIKMTLLWTVSYTSNIVRYNSTVGRFRSWILSAQKDKWDSLKTHMPLNRDFLNKLNQFQGSILIQCAWQDKFFTPLGVLKAIYTLPYNNYKVYIGSMDGHGSDVSDDEIEAQSQVVDDWYNYWLNDENNNVMNSAQKFTFASTTQPVQNGQWSFTREHSPTWPPGADHRLKLYFHPGGKLRNYANILSPDTISFWNDVKDTNLTMLEAVNWEFTGPEFAAKFGKTTKVFETDPIHVDYKMVGTPVLNLHYSASADLCQYNFQIFEVKPNNSAKLVTRVNFTNRDYMPNTYQAKYLEAIPHGHVFKQGNRIRIVATNLDNLTDGSDDFLRTNPHVLPVIKRSRNIIFMSQSRASYFEIPLSAIPIGIKGTTNELPSSIKLFQNYPNPFNPVTTISYDIPFAINVSLKLFDINGRVVKELVNKIHVAGKYDIQWNASDVSGGIYFARLTAGDYNQTIKLLLVK